ncbi:anti-sigma factor [Prosthecobacter sp.]|uniref:anti-sigma factor domain-containing protein n=1 Tax=Prosthecobacter sp. TaxID=1965333 RepID=UPI001D9A9724|nr:anti-sigma factor [Prosthecobacter sp.]MCB1277185.1 anti-sigma factor [Prosthecobacter sp.]
MMDERHEELAALNALGMLENDEKRSLDGGIARDKDLRYLSHEFDEVTAELGYLIAPAEPPANMKKRIRAKMRATGVKGVGISRGVLVGGLGWVLAAAFGLASVWLWKERSKMTQQLAAASSVIAPMAPAVDDGKVRTLAEELKSLRGDFEGKKAELSAEVESLRQRESAARARIEQLTAEADALKQKEAIAQMEIVTLQSSVWEYRKSVAAVVWDKEKHQGILRLEKMPKVEAGMDYQLWVVEPGKKDPVSAGVVQVDEKGFASVPFKPAREVGGAEKFSLSVEKKGGVEKSVGEIVFSSP